MAFGSIDSDSHSLFLSPGHRGRSRPVSLSLSFSVSLLSPSLALVASGHVHHAPRKASTHCQKELFTAIFARRAEVIAAAAPAKGAGLGVSAELKTDRALGAP